MCVICNVDQRKRIIELHKLKRKKKADNANRTNQE